MRPCRKKSVEERNSRLEIQREYMRPCRKKSVEERNSRLEIQREYMRPCRKKSVEERNSRLEIQREYMRPCRKKPVEERNSRLEKQREYTRAYSKNKSSERKEKELSTHITVDMTQLIRDFHNSISSGPLYVCTCCDQLSYKHSVCPADRIRLVNPDTVVLDDHMVEQLFIVESL
jgi:hypothetical protein